MKYYKVVDVADKLSKELGYRVSDSRLRRYDIRGIITAKRSKSGYRQFSLEDIATLKVVVVLSELGVPQATIKEFIRTNGEGIASTDVCNRIVEVMKLTSIALTLFPRNEPSKKWEEIVKKWQEEARVF